MFLAAAVWMVCFVLSALTACEGLRRRVLKLKAQQALWSGWLLCFTLCWSCRRRLHQVQHTNNFQNSPFQTCTPLKELIFITGVLRIKHFILLCEWVHTLMIAWSIRLQPMQLFRDTTYQIVDSCLRLLLSLLRSGYMSGHVWRCVAANCTRLGDLITTECIYVCDFVYMCLCLFDSVCVCVCSLCWVTLWLPLLPFNSPLCNDSQY